MSCIVGPACIRMSIESILRGYTSLTPLTKDKQQNRLRCSLGTVAKQRSALAGPSVTSSPATVDRELQFIPPPTTFIGLLCSSITTRSCTERSALPGGKGCNGRLTRSQNLTIGKIAGMTSTCGHAVCRITSSSRPCPRCCKPEQARTRPDRHCICQRVFTASRRLAG